MWYGCGKWSTLPARLPLGSGGGNLVNLNNVLYYMGGERATNTERNAPRKNTFFLDPAASNQWVETDSLNFARNGMAAAVLNNKIYAAGGSGGQGGPPPANQANAFERKPSTCQAPTKSSRRSRSIHFEMNPRKRIGFAELVNSVLRYLLRSHQRA